MLRFHFNLLLLYSILDDEKTTERKWFEPSYESAVQNTVTENSGISTSPKKDMEPNAFLDHVRNRPLSDELSTLSQDLPEETRPSFFDCSTAEPFLASSMTASTSPSVTGVPFPRKLPEITNRTDDVVDHRSVAIDRLKHVLDGIKFFDR
jgi:hypothetical protein